MADPWDLGRPGASESLWLQVVDRNRSAHRAERLAALPDANLQLPLAPAGNVSPYRGAQLVTVVLDADGANLHVDGALARLGGVTLPPPQVADLPDSKGYFAPLVFSTHRSLCPRVEGDEFAAA